MSAWATLRSVQYRLARLWKEGRTDADAHFEGYRAWREHLRKLGVESVEGLSVLDIGCGDRAQLSLLFASEGAKVTGLDTAPVALGLRRPKMWFRVARDRGLGAAGKQILRDALHTARYWRQLQRLAGRPLRASGVQIVRADAVTLPFAGATFDLIVSSAVWEHLSDVGAATGEVNRVLRQGGTAIIQIALFPALQGGHHADWHAASPSTTRTIRPWDHLRVDRLPYPLYLNEWREFEYRAVFDRVLDIFEWEDGELRGRDFLDASTLSLFPDYSERDLLLSSITAWAHRRA